MTGNRSDLSLDLPVRMPIPVPGDLQSRTSITIDGQTFEIEADDLESICELGRGAYGVVEKMKHRRTGTILAVKVSEYIPEPKNQATF